MGTTPSAARRVGDKAQKKKEKKRMGSLWGVRGKERGRWFVSAKKVLVGGPE